MISKHQFRELLRNNGPKPVISVHRGLWGPAPENSIEAVEKAAKLGIVEIDIQLASDGIPVVMHDDTLDRMTGISEPVSELSSAKIAGLSLRQSDGGETNPLTGQRVPTLEQLIRSAPAEAFFDFDVKHPGEVDAAADFFSDHTDVARGSLKIDTHSDADIRYLLELERKSGLMVMAKVNLSKSGSEHISKLRDADVAAAEVWFDDISQLTEACSAAGPDMAITTYTLDPVHCCGLSDERALANPGDVWGRLISSGIGVIMTDRSVSLAEYLRENY